MMEKEISERLRSGLIQRLSQSSSNTPTPYLDEDTVLEDGLRILLDRAFQNRQIESFWECINLLTGELPTYEQVRELYLSSYLASNEEELFQNMTYEIAMCLGASGLAKEHKIISRKNVVVFESSHLLALNSGIQRVARSIAREFSKDSDFLLLAVVPDGSGFTELTDAEFNHLTQDDFVSPESDLNPSLEPSVSYHLRECNVLVVDVSKSINFSSRLRALGAFSSNNLNFVGYDLIPVLAPEYVSNSEIESFVNYLQSAAESSAILCISDQTKTEFEGYLGARANVALYSGKIETVELPATQLVEDINPPDISKSILQLANSKYFLCVGTIGPRKNQDKVITAFKEFRNSHTNVSLVLVGRVEQDFVSEFRNLVSGKLKGEIHHFADVTDREISWLYQNSYATIQISSYEGYGLPVVESLINKKPVITNSFGVQRELSVNRGGIAVTNDTTSSVTELLVSLVSDQALYSKLVEQASKAEFKSVKQYALEIKQIMNKRDEH